MAAAEDITAAAEATPTNSPLTMEVQADLEAAAEFLTVDAEALCARSP